jgi:hypothetical protein
MIKKKILLLATVLMASASDLNQPNNIDFKGDIQKIVTEFKDIISNEIKKDTLSNGEKIKACRSFRLLCGYFYFTFEDQFLKKNINNNMRIKNNPKNQADFESFISDEYNKLINNIDYLDADNDYFEDCAKKFLAACDEFIKDILNKAF